MKRRKKFNFIPPSLMLFHRGRATDRKVQSSLPERLGLKPVSRQQFFILKTDPFTRWKKEPRFPQWHPESFKAKVLVAAIRNNHPITFCYHGGSTPGAKRTIHPAEVFTVGRGDDLYVSGWCMNQQAHRTFRMDRIELLM